MPKIDISEAHDLGADEASARVRNLVQQMRVRYGDKMSDVDEWWSGHGGGLSFKLMGAHVKGETDVSDTDIRVRVKVPMTAMMFRGMIEKTVRDELRACLAGPATGAS